jgi:hypothetical protein
MPCVAWSPTSFSFGVAALGPAASSWWPDGTKSASLGATAVARKEATW